MSDERPRLRLIPGGGDMVEAIEDLLRQVKEGTVVGVVLCGITEPDGEAYCGWTWAHKDGIAAPWARLLSATASAYHVMVSRGLDSP